MKVDLIDVMGSDLTVANAARVSFDKQSDMIIDCDLCGGDINKCWEHDDQCSEPVKKMTLSDKDKKLIKYLSDHNHWSPFSHCFVQFRVKAPIFVARQLQKHTVGLAWNEVSRRYVDSEPEFYFPILRQRAENVKQGSKDEFPVNLERCESMIQYITDKTKAYYNELLREGVCPEQARMILPQSMYTEWMWSGSLYAFARVCNLRLDSHTQKETQEIAKMISDHMTKLFPISWKELVKNG